MREKVEKTNVNNPKANLGARRIKETEGWETKLSIYVLIALQTLLQRLSGDRPLDKGQCKLTEVSLTIGKQISDHLVKEEYNTYELLGLGDLMIGAFLSNEYVSVYRNEAYSEWDSAAPYIVEVSDKFIELAEIPEKIKHELIRASVPESIPDVTYSIQGHNRKLVKEDRVDYNKDIREANAAGLPWINSVNKMQQIGWKINKDVLNVIDKSITTMKLPVGQRPYAGSAKKVKDALEKLKKKDTKANRNRYNKEGALWNVELQVLKAASKNLEIDIIHEKARELDSWGEFYQYVELDYRGRAYYQEPFMNYQGSDMARGLMLFNQGKPLGETGKKWLAIHTATCYNESYNINDIPAWCTYDYAALLREQQLEDISVDKMTLEDRVKWTEVNMDRILTHTEELKDCEKPVLYLACCIEWKNFKEDPEYTSYLPVPIDGSCNGYQHSGAIAKDDITGGLVSLVDQEIQADLYLVVAKALVKKNPKFFAARPTMRMKHIRKGIVKRAVMTRAYSAGIDTMAENMYKDCHVEGYTTKFNITMIDCLVLAADIYELISTVCPGATKTMKYLQDLAKFQLGEFKTYDPDGTEVSLSTKKKRHSALQAAKKTGDQDKIDVAAAVVKGMESKCVRGNGSTFMEWVTPTGFPVRYYAYHQSKYKFLATIPGYTGGAAAQAGRIKHVVLVDRNVPDGGAFQAGISPNFIHSMDAAHMAGVIWNWDDPFGAIHDSYSALACDVDRLAKLTREVFVDIYNNDDSYELVADMILKGTQRLDFDTPEVGQLEVSDVLTSRYFFS